MTDEEKAEEYLQSIEGDDCVIITDREERKQAFLAGLKAGRPQWHDLRKDPNDLPKNCESDFLLCFRGGTHYGIGFLSGLKFVCYGGEYDDVIAWCEIPTFDKE